MRDPDLFARIAAHPVGPPDAALSFSARLARENRWAPEYAERVIEEYRRFCYLACIARRTKAGKAAQARACADVARLSHSPTRAEMSMAVALFGTGVLPVSPFATNHDWLRTTSDGGGSDSGSDSGGGGCGGCGGD